MGHSDLHMQAKSNMANPIISQVARAPNFYIKSIKLKILPLVTEDQNIHIIQFYTIYLQFFKFTILNCQFNSIHMLIIKLEHTASIEFGQHLWFTVNIYCEYSYSLCFHLDILVLFSSDCSGRNEGGG